jgi:thiamine pyrophosphate-dependent acetolactate synthase large subunit-like protein
LTTDTARAFAATTSALSGGEAVVRALEAHGVELVFGIPGTHSLPIYRHLGGSSLRHVLPRHEQGAGFTADGYARASGRPGVCLVTTGPGVTNVATAAAQAYSDSVPVLVLSPGMPTDVYRRDVGYVHEAKDQSRAMDNLVSWSHRASSPADAVAAIYRAFAEFASGRPRPVHVEIPLDVLDAIEEVALPEPVSPPRPAASAEAVAAAAALLAESRRPAVLVGGGAQGAAPEVRQLVRALGALVFTSAAGKGVHPEDDELTVGTVLNYAAARTVLGECDALVVVGSELSDVDLESPLVVRGHVIRIDIEPAQLQKNLPADCAILADAADAGRALAAALPPRDAAGAAERARDARERVAPEIAAKSAGLPDVASVLRSCLDGDAVVACDTAMVCYRNVLPARILRSPRSLCNPTGFATLGYGLPAGIGAKLAQPDRQVVVVTGDGGILFTLSELATAVEEKLSLPVVVANNRGYGEIREGMLDRGIEPLGVTFDPPDFGLVAKAFGAESAVVSDEPALEDALEQALAADGPTLVEVVS